MHTKKRRQSRSKRQRGTRRLRGGQPLSLALPKSTQSSKADISILSLCDKNMLDKYDTPQYRSALETIIRELSKYNPLAIIGFIERHFNKGSILAHFNNDKCSETQLDNLKRKLDEYKQKIVKTNTKKYEAFTMKTAYSILNKGFVEFSGSKSQKGGGDNPICPICFEDFNNGRVVIVPLGCIHGGHALCLRRWWGREIARCPICRQESALPLPSPEELAERLQYPEEVPEEQQQREREENERHAIEQEAREASEAARARNIMGRRFAYVLGVAGVAFYNQEYVMEVLRSTRDGVDPNMSEQEFAVNNFITILMFILMTLGLSDQLEQIVNWYARVW